MVNHDDEFAAPKVNETFANYEPPKKQLTWFEQDDLIKELEAQVISLQQGYLHDYDLFTQQQNRIESLESLLKELEWSDHDYHAHDNCCPSCGGYQEDPGTFGSFGHTVDCKLNNLLKK